MPARTLRRLTEFARDARSAGIALTVATIVALVWANTGEASYGAVAESLHRVVNDGLMAGFFLLVGLEIRREVVAGELGSVRRAATPIVAGLAGLVVPALLYAAIVRHPDASGGWGIPMATDIAFALGALALVGADLSMRVRTFMLTLGVADDVLAIVVLVVFYAGNVRASPLAFAAIGLVSIVVVHRLPRGHTMLAAAAAICVWIAFDRANVEPALAGFPIGLLLPTKTLGPRRLERLLQPWIVLVILPLFAVVNVGIRIDVTALTTGAAGTVFVGVLIARVVGKPLGIGITVAVMRRSHRMYPEPHDPIGHFVSAGALAAVGFTIPLLIVDIALPEGAQADAARAALLVASVVAVGLGWAIDRATRRPSARSR